MYMIAFGHTAIGTSIGVITYSQFASHLDPVTGLFLTTGLGIISHYLADSIPHGHFFRGTKYYRKLIVPVIIFDLIISFLLFGGIALLQSGFDLRFWYILFGIAGAQLPDILEGLIYINLIPNKGLIKKENKLHTLVHWHGVEEKTLLLDLRDIWQFLVVIVALYFLIKL